MTPPALDRDQAGRRLRALSESLGELDALRDVTVEQMAAEPLTRAAAERLLQVIVDLAVDVNSHISVAVHGVAPQTGRESFETAAATGALEVGLAERLAPAAGLRNVLVHRYTDIRPDLVAEAVPEVLDGFAEYVRQVASFLQGRPS